MIKRLHIILLAACIFVHWQVSYAQAKPPLEYQVKAAFLFNFTRFVQWPPTAFAADDAPFVIGIVGNDPFGTYIDDLTGGERVEGHPIVIRRYAADADMSGCNLLFVSNADVQTIKTILAQIQHSPVLTVSDSDGFIKAGGMIRFYKDDNHVKMEIKLPAAKAMHLDVSAKLLQIAKITN